MFIHTDGYINTRCLSESEDGTRFYWDDINLGEEVGEFKFKVVE